MSAQMYALLLAMGTTPAVCSKLHSCATTRAATLWAKRCSSGVNSPGGTHPPPLLPSIHVAEVEVEVNQVGGRPQAAHASNVVVKVDPSPVVVLVVEEPTMAAPTMAASASSTEISPNGQGGE